jgi:ACT domain-containing protein
MSRTIITVVGKDTVGIIAAVCSYLAQQNVNILDISQTIVQEFFTMMMIVDMNHCQQPFDEFATELSRIGEGKGVQVKCQREEIFDKMHRI